MIIHISYTAKFDSLPVGNALDTLKTRIDNDLGAKFLLISLQHDFPNEYTLLKNGGDGTEVSLTIGQTHFPYFTMGKTIKFTPILVKEIDNGNIIPVDIEGNAEKIIIGNTQTVIIKKSEFDAIDESVNTSIILLEYYIS